MNTYRCARYVRLICHVLYREKCLQLSMSNCLRIFAWSTTWTSGTPACARKRWSTVNRRETYLHKSGLHHTNNAWSSFMDVCDALESWYTRAKSGRPRWIYRWYVGAIFVDTRGIVLSWFICRNGSWGRSRRYRLGIGCSNGIQYQVTGRLWTSYVLHALKGRTHAC